MHEVVECFPFIQTTFFQNLNSLGERHSCILPNTEYPSLIDSPAIDELHSQCPAVFRGTPQYSANTSSKDNNPTLPPSSISLTLPSSFPFPSLSMASKRMTANPIKPARYRPGKPVVEEHSSEEDEEEVEVEEDIDEDDDRGETAPGAISRPPPKATSFPSDTTKIASNLKQVDLNERKRRAALQEAARVEAENAARALEEEGFVTEESEEEGKDGEDENETSGSESGSEESSSEEEEAPPKVHLRPTFIRKGQRKEGTGGGAAAGTSKNEDEIWEEEEVRRKAKADAMIQEQIEKNLAAQAAGKKDWDDDEASSEADQVDDTDGLDPETERAEWKLRELKRVQRERAAIETAEKEREEIERRRNLSREDREAEDNQFLAAQQTERDSKGKMGYMQKYFHKGAFFQDDQYAQAEGLHKRDIMASRYQDDTQNRELLPQYMQIRDMAKLGRKGRSKYKDLKTEDTGRWGGAGLGERGGPGERGGGERRWEGGGEGRWGSRGGRGSGGGGGSGGRGGSGMDSTSYSNRKRSRSPPYRERERERERERRGDGDDYKRRKMDIAEGGSRR